MRVLPLLLALALTFPVPCLALDLSFEATLSADSSSDPGDEGLPRGERGSATLRVMAGEEVSRFRFEGHLLLGAAWQEPGVALPTLAVPFRVEELAWEEEWGEEGRGSAEVDRLLASFEGEGWRVTAGRQAVAWGEGWFFNPLDLFGGFPLTALERTYLPGIDALAVTAGLGRFSELSLVGVPATEGAEASGAGRLLLPAGRGAITLAGGSVSGETVAGAGWSADLRGSKLTLAHLVREQSSLTAAGWERQTGPGTHLLVEAERDTGGSDRAAAEGSLQLSPLWVGAAAVFLNLSDGSGLARVDATRSLSDFADLRLGASAGWGDRPVGLFPRSEFGSYPVTLFLLGTVSW